MVLYNSGYDSILLKFGIMPQISVKDSHIRFQDYTANVLGVDTRIQTDRQDFLMRSSSLLCKEGLNFLNFAHRTHLYVPCGSHNKHWSLPYVVH
jgi:hypothetical protein